MSDLFDEGSRQPRPMPPAPPTRRSRALIITGAVLVVGFFSLTTIASFLTDRLWFGAIGYSSVFSTLFWTRTGLFLVFAALMALVVGANMWLAYRFRPLFRPSSPEQTGLDRYRDAVTPIRTWLLVGVSVLLGLFAGGSAAGQWREYMLWRNGQEFGQQDQYFDRDIGFYVFDLPWLHYLTDSVMAFSVVALLMAGLVHYLYGGIRLQTQHDRLSGAAQVQLSVLLGVFVLAKAADYWLDRFDLVHQGGRLITGITFTDDKAVIPAKNILMGIAIICAVLFFLNVWRRTWMLPSVGLALLVLSAILLGLIWPGIVQQFQVDPTEADKEAPYIAANISATREAYELDGVEKQPFVSSVSLDDAKPARVTSETEKVPLVDPNLVRQLFEQQQQVRAYYSVADVLDVDRYTIQGEERALVLGVRELDQSGLNQGDRNWTNLHTVYTHGNGVIAAFANQRPEDNGSERSRTIQWAEGQQSNQDVLYRLFPDGYESRVYFGETSPEYSIVGKVEGGPDVELDLGNAASDPEEGQTTTYDGKGGVEVGSLMRQLLYAVRFGDPNFILSERVNENSKVLYYRQPLERVEKLAPWLTLDKDPYPAVVDGRILWIVDGYTTTDRYPLSQRESFEEMTSDSLDEGTAFGALPTDEINYMRNAVKVTLDAYDGTVNIYAWDEEDPILQAWRGAFPDVVQDRDAIPDSVLEHLRYPEDMFKVQRYQFARYHVTDERDWYQGNDRWAVPEDPEAPGNFQPPYRLFINDEDGEGQTFSMTSVYVPFNKNNLASFVSVNADATDEDYGKIRVLQLPNEQTPGPGLIKNQMTTDEEVRNELLAFQSGGSRPVYGNLLTLPVGDGLMYVQPVYAIRELSDASYPELQFVIVSYGDRVGIGDTLTAALGDVLGVDTSAPPSPEPPRPGDGGPDDEEPTGTVDEQIRRLLIQAQRAFDDAEAAQRSGDTVTWAEKTEEAQRLIERAVALAEQQQEEQEAEGEEAAGAGG
ncbi:UPF0182 family protein [Nocardioides sp. GCM10027113]|uniref:UPF0182 family membrane protein n=1 Tax=unclassified Nocardioides TaxID=2615069 RepID=UPI00360B859D